MTMLIHNLGIKKQLKNNPYVQEHLLQADTYVGQ